MLSAASGRITPFARPQVNSAAAACLYKLAGEWAAPSPDAVLLDLYCGCGSFGVTLARRVRQVIGIDNNAGSIAGAKEVAAANGLGNCEFIAAAVEATLQEVLHRPDVRSAEDVVAIVDPPRGGAFPLLICGCLDAEGPIPPAHRPQWDVYGAQ